MMSDLQGKLDDAIDQNTYLLGRLERAEADLAAARQQLDQVRADLQVANEEIMRHQAGKSYEVGYEHGQALAEKFKTERDSADHLLDQVRTLALEERSGNQSLYPRMDVGVVLAVLDGKSTIFPPRQGNSQ